MKKEKFIMNANELARYLNIHRETVYLYAKSGKIPAFKIGYSWRFKKDSIDKWMSEKEMMNFEETGRHEE